MFKIYKTLFTLLEHISPKVAGFIVLRLWLSTRRFEEPAREKIWSKSATVSNLVHQYGPIKLYQWQQAQKEAPLVLLIHGWNGRGLQLGSFINPLLDQGFNVITFDGPGHGRSYGKESNLFRFASVVTTIAKTIGPLDSIIAHSFGAMVMAQVARNGLNIRKAVAISSPKSIDVLLNYFCLMLKIKSRTKENLLLRLKQRFGEDLFTRLSVINNVKHLSIAGMIVHDLHDNDIPVAHAHEINQCWPDSNIVITENLGHQRILRDPHVVNTIVDFISKN